MVISQFDLMLELNGFNANLSNSKTSVAVSNINLEKFFFCQKFQSYKAIRLSA